MSLLIVIAFCGKDVDRAIDLLQWIKELGGCKQHEVLLVCDPETPSEESSKVLELSLECFKNIDMHALPEHIDGWIPGSNSLFRLAAKIAQERNTPFLFLEPDAVPLKAGWLNQIEDAYAKCGKYFMGSVVTHQLPNLPSPYFEGVGVYGMNAIDITTLNWRDDQSWTLACAPAVVPLAVNSPLFRHLWGIKDKPPTFAENNIPGTNVFCLRQLPPDAVLFHRCKDGSLIRLLRKSIGIKSEAPALATLFAFCSKDQHLMAKSLAWLSELHPQLPRTCVLHYDRSVSMSNFNNCVTAARQAFKSVMLSQYAAPKRPFVGWPGAPNWAFATACQSMQKRALGPWIWFEADAVALRPDWLYMIERAYADHGKAYMGPVIRNHHMNGTASVYPLDAFRRFGNRIMQAGLAFDMAIADVVIPNCHDSFDITYHDDIRKFETWAEVQSVIKPEFAVYHPCKNGRLIDHLRAHKPK